MRIIAERFVITVSADMDHKQVCHERTAPSFHFPLQEQSKAQLSNYNCIVGPRISKKSCEYLLGFQNIPVASFDNG